VQTQRDAYLKADSIVNREIRLFEDWMNNDLTSSIKTYVEANIAQERRKLKSMEKAFHKIKEGQIQKCSLNDLEEDENPKSRIDQEDEGRRRRMQYRQLQLEASSTLRTSSSLPSLNQGRKPVGRSLYTQDSIEEEEDYGSTTRTGSFDERTSVWTMNVSGRTGRHSVPFEGQAL
jgi:hypothetical protein